MATRTPARFTSTRHEGTPLSLPRYTPYTKSAQRSRFLSRTPLPSSRLSKLKGQSGRDVRSSSTSQVVQRSTRKKAKELNLNEAGGDLSSSIAGKSWRVYRASPFYRLNLDKKSLKAYERSLNSYLLSEMSTKGHHQQPCETRRKISFKILRDFSALEYAIEVQVSSGDEHELICLLCCGENDSENDIQSLDKHDLTALPICLIKSTVLLKECFLSWLEGMFGCKVTPLWFSPIDLAWLVSLCSGIGEPLHPTELTYHVPGMVHGLDTICFNMAAKDAKKLWDSIHDLSSNSQDFFTHEEAALFLSSLQTHFYHHFKIHLTGMQLTTVATSVACFGKEGRLKILQQKFSSYILQQIVSIAQLASV